MNVYIVVQEYEYVSRETYWIVYWPISRGQVKCSPNSEPLGINFNDLPGGDSGNTFKKWQILSYSTLSRLICLARSSRSILSDNCF